MQPREVGKISSTRWRDGLSGTEGMDQVFKQQGFINGQWVAADDGSTFAVTGARHLRRASAQVPGELTPVLQTTQTRPAAR